MKSFFREVCSVILAVLLAGSVRAASTNERTSENNEHLKKWFAKFPDADADHDGIMTSDEAWYYHGGLSERIRQAREKKKMEADQAVKKDGAVPKEGRLKPDFANFRYGPHERNVFDFWQAKSDAPTPLVIFYHGGGWRSGDKRDVSDKTIQALLDSGISVAAVNYRYTTSAPLPAPYLDSARALQLLRSKAREWNLDPTRVAAYGPSAGAGISLWLGFHEDLAEPGSDDPIARQSTRLTAIGSIAGQCTYDPNLIREWVGNPAYRHTVFLWAYGVKTRAELSNPKLQAVYDEMSPITHLNAGDPPVFQYYTEPDSLPVPDDAPVGLGIHHPIFGHKLKSAMDKLGIECVDLHVVDIPGDPQLELVKFLRRHLGQQ